jgi:hypothetical protein
LVIAVDTATFRQVPWTNHRPARIWRQCAQLTAELGNAVIGNSSSTVHQDRDERKSASYDGDGQQQVHDPEPAFGCGTAEI